VLAILLIFAVIIVILFFFLYLDSIWGKFCFISVLTSAILYSYYHAYTTLALPEPYFYLIVLGAGALGYLALSRGKAISRSIVLLTNKLLAVTGYFSIVILVILATSYYWDLKIEKNTNEQEAKATLSAVRSVLTGIKHFNIETLQDYRSILSSANAYYNTKVQTSNMRDCFKKRYYMICVELVRADTYFVNKITNAEDPFRSVGAYRDAYQNNAKDLNLVDIGRSWQYIVYLIDNIDHCE
jgi:hypothetical protein